MPIVSSIQEQKIILVDSVIETFREYKQDKRNKPEAGGQLFAEINDNKDVIIRRATTPKRRDKQGRYSFIPDLKQQNLDIQELFSIGLHYVGDWHTHPEQAPTPSHLDIQTVHQTFRTSNHQLNYFILVIVGMKTDDDLDLWTGLINNKKVRKLTFEKLDTLHDITDIVPYWKNQNS